MKNDIKKFSSFKNDEQGSVLIMSAAFILVAFAIGGAAVDFGQAQLLQMKKQQAADMATLAAAYVVSKDDKNPDEIKMRENAANRYYNLNFPVSYLGVTRKPPTYNYNIGSGDITVVGNSDNIKTNFITTLGTSSLKVGADTKVNIPSKDVPDFDVVVVVDESSSTTAKPDGKKTILQMEKDAIGDMLSVLFPDDQDENPNLRFGLIGYTGAIMQASSLTSDKDAAKKYINDLYSYNQNYDHWGLEAALNMISGVWNGYVAPQHCEKPKGHKKDGCDYNYVDGPTKNSPKTDLNHCWVNDNTGGVGCIPERNTAVSEPATKRTKVNIKTGKIDPLSPERNVVLISDGYIMEEPSPCSAGNWYHSSWPGIDTEVATPDEIAKGCKNYDAFVNMCKKIKDSGATLYVISFISVDDADVTHLKECSSGTDKYFYAPDSDTLKTILTGIATKVHSIRIVD